MKDKTKTAKGLRILKTAFRWLKIAFKWANENLTVLKVIKWGFVVLIAGTIVKSFIFG